MDYGVKVEGKNTRYKVTIVILILLLIVVTSAAGYLYLNKDGNTSSNKKIEVEKEDKDDGAFSNAISNGFIIDKSLNSNGKSYSLVSGNSSNGINLSFDSSKTTMSVSICNCKFNLSYSIGWVTANEENCDGITYENRGTISFDQEVQEVLIGGFGQSNSNDTMLFLMKDGTVEYIPIRKAYTSTQPEKVTSYGKIANVDGIVKFYQVSAGQYVTVLAQKADGSFYDLNESLTSINAW